jgi:hypothetical protein
MQMIPIPPIRELRIAFFPGGFELEPEGLELLQAGGTLSPDELEFVGVVDPRGGSRAHPGGWRQPNTAAFELDSILSAEDTALLQSLMNAGSTDRVEFLGG